MTAALIAAPSRVMHGLHARYGDIFTIHSLAFGTEVIVTQPASVRQVLTGDSETYSAAEANAPLGYILGDRSLLLLDGPPHLRIRKLLLPPFHGDRMTPLAATMRDATVRAFAGVRPGDVIDIGPVFQRITLDIILRAVLGLPPDERAAPLRDALTVLINEAQSPLALLWMSPKINRLELPFPTPWGRVSELRAKADRLLFEHVRARRALAEADRPRDLLDTLIDARDEEGAPLSDQELRDQLVTLLLAGHETTATSLAWAIEEIVHHPGEGARLGEEARSATGGAPLEAEHVAGLVRTDSVVKEALRLYPVTGAVGRRLKRPVTLEGYDLPAGVTIATSFSLLHRRADLYPDPQAFVPDRFIGKKIDPYEWVPFGAGAHRCLGMHFALYEMKIVLATLLANLEIEAVRKKSIVGLRSFVLSPRGGTKVRVVRNLG
jgi:cytochrome P450